MLTSYDFFYIFFSSIEFEAFMIFVRAFEVEAAFLHRLTSSHVNIILFIHRCNL